MKNSSSNLPRLIQRFFGEHLPLHRAASPCTVAAYRDTIRMLLCFLQTKLRRPPSALSLADFDANRVLQFLDHLERDRGNSARTRNARLAAIRSFLRYAQMEEPAFLHTIQRTLAIPAKKHHRATLTALTREEIEALLAAPDDNTWSGRRDRILLLTLYNTGARVSEITGACVADANLQQPGSLRMHGKGRKDRVVPLWKKTCAGLKEWVRSNELKESSPLFPNAGGTAMTRSGVEKRIRRAVLRATETCRSLTKKKVSPHTIRHTTATHLLQAGVDLSMIALWLGHESIATTHIYMASDTSMKENALSHLQPPSWVNKRYKAKDHLLQYLESL